jgi:hypothetical protein
MTTTRRDVLRLGTAALMLPYLPSILASAGASSPVPPRRLMVFIVPHGMPDHLWAPSTTGGGWTTEGILTALEPVRSDTVVISGLASLPGGGDFEHGESLAVLLRASRMGATSFDQVLARTHAGLVPRTFLQVSGERSTPTAEPRLLRQRVSWMDASTPASRIVSPAALYRIIAPGATPTAAVLDAAWRDLARFGARPGTSDASSNAQYAAGLTALEDRGTFQAPASCAPPGAPPDDLGSPYAGEDDLRRMLTLCASALACDVTRVITFMLGNSGSDRPLGFLGLPYGHHGLSHSPDWASHLTFGRWAVGLWTELVQTLASIEDVDGASLLDHTDVLFLSDMGDGSQHRRTRLPVLLAGPLAAATAGQHLQVTEGTPVSNLFTSLLQAHGLDVDRFGDATGRLTALG